MVIWLPRSSAFRTPPLPSRFERLNDLNADLKHQLFGGWESVARAEAEAAMSASGRNGSNVI